MFSQKVRKPGLCCRHQGYSLVELVVSVLLIAAIAVLSLPTYQDFSPHGEAIPEQAGPPLELFSQPAPDAPERTTNPDQPVTDPAPAPDLGSLGVADNALDPAEA